MTLIHSLRIMDREVERAKQEHKRVEKIDPYEGMKVQKRIDEMRIELIQLEMLSEAFRTDRDLLKPHP